MNDYSIEKKLFLLHSQNGRHVEDAAHYIQLLRRLAEQFQTSGGAELEPEHLRQLQDLVISLRTQSYSYLEEFLAKSGLELLNSLLEACHEGYKRERTALFLLYALRALLNSPNGRSAVLQDEPVLRSIARAIDIRDVKCKVVSIEILAGLCFIPDEGHSQVLKALTQVSSLLGERTSERETDRVRTAIVGLVNALLRTGPAESSAVYRSHLRCELLLLGMASVAERCRESASGRLDDHLDLFEMMRKEDELTLNGAGGSSSEDSGSSSPVDFETAWPSRISSPCFSIFLWSHATKKHVPLWRLFDLILQHLTLQTTMQGISDVHQPIQNSVDMNEILARLQNHCDYERIEKELEKSKEDVEAERTRAIELENRLADFQDGRASSGSRISLASSSSSSPSDPCPSPPLLPPVCPPAAPPPPPPPPIPGGPPKDVGDPPKKVPTPSGPLKSLNWAKLGVQKTRSTVWDSIEDEKVYKQLDLDDIAMNFAASSSHKDDDTETIAGTISRRHRESQITVIDPRRYQNCTIMLSKLKLSHKEIRSALMSMDEKGKLPKDMIEQMLKFVPSKEEVNLITDATVKNGSPTVLALADRYLYEVSQIPRFEQRLRCLYIIRTFKDRVDGLLPYIQCVTKTSTSLQSNKRFRQYLAMVLAIGNYLNHGKRLGNAYGFELNSLNKLCDVKNSLRSDRNLLHYVVQFIEKKFPDMTKMKRELAGVFEAARFNQGEVAAEIRSLEQALLTVRTELNFIESARKEELPEDVRDDAKKDRFPTVAKQFVNSSTSEFHALEKAFHEMKNKFSECATHYCFNASTTTPEELFSVLAKFLSTFAEYHQQLWAEVEEEEKIKRQTIARTFLAKKSTSRRKEKERDFEQLISALQSGDIFKEELSRLRTSFRPKKTSKAA
ncbi:unnamed protein product [Caenorhabditis auriculariae]|uniref:Uncharacterized protein n=1 Tax=Caenorhabditis auriculariae TaxID=2777116 RepID=A0A8S1H9C3_9PELO|nr:unnamed protein product [Caenorhabditis auriculariae]